MWVQSIGRLVCPFSSYRSMHLVEQHRKTSTRKKQWPNQPTQWMDHVDQSLPKWAIKSNTNERSFQCVVQFVNCKLLICDLF